MRAPAFWWRGEPSAGAILLRPAAALYGAAAASRMRRSGETAALPVVCIGNFTAGGAGKTPTALAVGDLLGRLGRRPAFLSRGYGGRLAGPVRVDPARHDADAVGDEPLLLARAGPAVVSRDRPAGARVCAETGADVIVMDDGLQNPSLAKTLTIAVVDAAQGIGNGLCLPAGPLRAPLAAQWARVDALVLVGAGRAGEAVAAEAERRGKPVWRAALKPDPAAASDIRGRRVLAFAGIGRPEKFFETLEGHGATLAGRRSFADHHRYTRDEIRRLADEAASAGALLITTEKDFARLGALLDPGLPVAVLPVTLALADEAGVQAWLGARLAAAP